jgi:hypothetical protein
MIGEKQRRFVKLPGQQMATPLQRAIVLLAEAHDYACDLQCNGWEFAVEIDALADIGSSVDDLRWFVNSGYAKHKQEITQPSDARRKFRATETLQFTRRTCFVVTEKGLQLTAVASEFFGKCGLFA